MSLIFQAPLMGDLTQQGLSKATISYIGSPTINDDGRLGSATLLGTGNAVKISSEIGQLQTLSVCCWTKFSAVPTAGEQVIVGCPNTGGFQLEYRSAGLSSDPHTIAFGYRNTSTGWQFALYDTTNFALTEWHHYCGTWNNTSKTLKLYIDGILVNTKKASGDIRWPDAGTQWAIGCHGNLQSYWLDGLVNDARIYDHCLSDKEVAELAKGLLMHYKLGAWFAGLQNIPEKYINWGLTDCSGYKRNLRCNIDSKTPVYMADSSARYGSCVYIGNGSSDANPMILTNTSNVVIPLNTPITVSFWIKSAILSSNQYILTDVSNGANSGKVLCYIHANGNLYFGTLGSTISYSFANYYGSWAHVCFTTNNVDKRTMYINGGSPKKINTGAISTTGRVPVKNIRLFGTNASGSNSPKNFYISDLRIYATCFTDAQVNELYNTTASIDHMSNSFVRELIE